LNLTPGTNPDRGHTIVLAPAGAGVPNSFRRVEKDPAIHTILLSALQRLRGRVYLEDGAINRSDLTFDGRFIQPIDNFAWHLVRLNEAGEVCGCARYMAHPGPLCFDDMGVSRTPLSRSWEWGRRLRAAIESEIELAASRRVDYVEVGGWALAPEVRCTVEALRIALGMFSMARLLGGCIGVTTATRRHCSASILRRIGGHALTSHGDEIPRYFDPRFDCEMEILRFDSAKPNPRFETWIDELKGYLSGIPVVKARADAESRLVRDPVISAA
jgi:hypothetical protein